MTAESNQHETSRPLQTILPEHLNPQLVRKVPLEFLKEQCAIPILLQDGQVAVAMADPANVETYDAIVSALGRPCGRVTCPAAEIEQAISSCYYQNRSIETDYDDQQTHDVQDFDNNIDNFSVQTQAEDLLNIANKAPAIKLVNNIFFQAVQSRASDIHVEPYENFVRVRFRIDGVLRDILKLPRQQTAALISRLKIMSNLDIAERRLPQDGQSRVKIGQDLVDIRVSVIPTSCGERIVLRLLDNGCGRLSLEGIGFCPEILNHFRNLIQIPHGIILLTGPTGSGKTTTLYAAPCAGRPVAKLSYPF